MSEVTLQLRQVASLDVRGHHDRVVLVVWLHAQHGCDLLLRPAVLGPRHREAVTQKAARAPRDDGPHVLPGLHVRLVPQEATAEDPMRVLPRHSRVQGALVESPVWPRHAAAGARGTLVHRLRPPAEFPLHELALRLLLLLSLALGVLNQLDRLLRRVHNLPSLGLGDASSGQEKVPQLNHGELPEGSAHGAWARRVREGPLAECDERIW
mmetsp:Transcript_31556/g.100606  ORF Transcript_31556/g.100606 Transcript_31556/m.100606 type:complete len:210 (+) Transcript_31556:1063-1692(+)